MGGFLSRKTNRKNLTKLEALYAKLPTVACQGLCAGTCGPVPMAMIEATALKAADAKRRLPMIGPDLTCGYLTKDKRCSVYASRPLICRVWGVTKSLSCMYGCVPDRWLGYAEFISIAQAIERLGGPIVISGEHGPIVHGTSYFDLDVRMHTPEALEVMAEKTRGLRALHGGRIVGVYPAEKDGWIDLDKKKGPWGGA